MGSALGEMSNIHSRSPRMVSEILEIGKERKMHNMVIKISSDLVD